MAESYSYSQLLKTMLECEVRNKLAIDLAEAARSYQDTTELSIVLRYFEKRIEQLSKPT